MNDLLCEDILSWVVNLQYVEMSVCLLKNVCDSQWWIWFKCFLIILEIFVDWWLIWWFTQFFNHPWKIYSLMINLTIHTYVDHPRRIYWFTLWWIWLIHVFIILEECILDYTYFGLFISFWWFTQIIDYPWRMYVLQEYVLKPKIQKE